jgi:hypothetical protein
LVVLGSEVEGSLLVVGSIGSLAEVSVGAEVLGSLVALDVSDDSEAALAMSSADPQALSRTAAAASAIT